MKVLIFGANSSISKALKPKLSEIADVLCGGRKNADWLGDLSQNTFAPLPKQLDILIHTAAYFGGKTIDEICEAIQINEIGTIRLLDAALKFGVKKFIYISSVYSHLKIDSPFYSIYSISKKHSEELLQFYVKDKNIELLILRPSQIYGNLESNRSNQPFFYSIVEKVMKNEQIVFYGKNEAIRNFIHIEDLVQIVINCIKNNIVGDYDCPFPENVTYSQVARAAIDTFQSKSKIIFDETMPDIPSSKLSYSLNLYPKINFVPSIKIYQGLKKLALEYKYDIKE